MLYRGFPSNTVCIYSKEGGWNDSLESGIGLNFPLDRRSRKTRPHAKAQ